MNTKAQCPCCSKPIPVLAVMRGSLPSRIRCPHCKERIRLANLKLFLRIYVPAVLFLAAFFVVSYLVRIMPGWVSVVLAMVLFGAIEFGVSAAVCRYGIFEKAFKFQIDTPR